MCVLPLNRSSTVRRLARIFFRREQGSSKIEALNRKTGARRAKSAALGVHRGDVGVHAPVATRLSTPHRAGRTRVARLADERLSVVESTGVARGVVRHRAIERSRRLETLGDFAEPTPRNRARDLLGWHARSRPAECAAEARGDCAMFLGERYDVALRAPFDTKTRNRTVKRHETQAVYSHEHHIGLSGRLGERA